MPLTGEAKKLYQRDYMRRRQGTKRPRVGLITSVGSNKDALLGSNKLDLKARLGKVGLNTVGNRVSLQSTRSPLRMQ